MEIPQVLCAANVRDPGDTLLFPDADSRIKSGFCFVGVVIDHSNEVGETSQRLFGNIDFL